MEGLIGAGRHERTGKRLNYRNGFRDRKLDTRLGALPLRIPKLRQGSYFPPSLEPRFRCAFGQTRIDRYRIELAQWLITLQT